VKVSPLHCVCLLAIAAQLTACGDAADAGEAQLGQTNGAPESDGNGTASPASDAPLGNVSQPDDDAGECPDPCAEPSECGQICLTLKGVGSRCQLVPTANDLTRPPRSVHFDCKPIPRGPDGYDFDALGHITLMGNTCAALQKSGPHRVTLTLGCPPR
jgi:hypothetical protein